MAFYCRLLERNHWDSPQSSFSLRYAKAHRSIPFQQSLYEVLKKIKILVTLIYLTFVPHWPTERKNTKKLISVLFLFFPFFPFPKSLLRKIFPGTSIINPYYSSAKKFAAKYLFCRLSHLHAQIFNYCITITEFNCS